MGKSFNLTDENVVGILDVGNNESTEIHPSDPLTKATIRITLDQLRPYDKNPRISRNPKFNEILSSIENTGLDHPPNISRRSPDDPHYMIMDGGNTRLEILGILYKKYTQLANEADNEDERLKHLKKAESFYVIDCTFKPWSRESKALAGHMSENENQGSMLFIEKALAVRDLREEYEKEDRERAQQKGREFKEKPLSGRKLAERITRDGWPISQSHITRYDYAVNTLLDGASRAFWAGAGEPLVRQLRKYDKAYTRFWKETNHGQRDAHHIQSLFIDALREHDGETVDIDGFLKSINERLGDLLDLDPSTVAAEVEAIVSGPVDITSSSESESVSLEAIKPDKEERRGESSRSEKNQAPQTPQSSGHTSEQSDKSHTKSKGRDQQRKPMPVWPEAGLGSDALLSMILERVKPLSDRYGLTIQELSQEDRDSGRINAFFIAPMNQEFIPGEDDESAAVWWALTKVSGTAHEDLDNQYQHFESSLRHQYQLYIDHQKRGLIGTLLFLEDFIIANPDNPGMCNELFEIQRLCGRYVQHITSLRGL
ncbi:MAG: ParB family protein [Candidatus Thiodiazotropha sp.]